MATKGNPIVTTSWDDGITDDIRLAEMLDKYKLKGTFYISRVPAHKLLEEKDIIEIDRHFETGAHTVTHPDLTGIPPGRAEREIIDSKVYLENLTGHAISMFCYPYGLFNTTVKDLVKKSGFTGARTCLPGGLNFPADNFQWHISLFASNGSPLMALKICLQAHIWRPGGLLDWESRAKFLFDQALAKGGVYHIYGHSGDFEANKEWDKLQRVFAYISNRDGVRYLNNGDIFKISPLKQ
jgi:peptidoglycan/xylan/chitin deacetylase (PgdA/CDA1 family)